MQVNALSASAPGRPSRQPDTAQTCRLADHAFDICMIPYGSYTYATETWRGRPLDSALQYHCSLSSYPPRFYSTPCPPRVTSLMCHSHTLYYNNMRYLPSRCSFTKSSATMASCYPMRQGRFKLLNLKSLSYIKFRTQS
jgi:hypothetical protein